MKYLVTLNPGHHQLYIDEHDSILKGIRSHGFQLPYSCENGACYLCEAKLIEGKVYDQHSRQVLSEQTNSVCYTCITQPRSDIILTVENLMAPGECTVQTMACQIKSTEYLSDGVLKVTLLTPANKSLTFYPGQYLDICLDHDKACSFSIANAPIKKRHIELHIGLDSTSDDLKTVLLKLKTQATISIEIPKGDCFIKNPPNQPLLLIAASTGFSQIKSILEFLFSKGLSQPVYFYWGSRQVSGLYYHERLKHWEKENPLFTYRAVVSAENSDNLDPDIKTGLLYQAILEDFSDLGSFQAIISGSPAMVYATVDALKPLGLKLEKTFSDVFSYAPRNLPATPDQ